MAVQRRPEGSGSKCEVCGKPLYRPRTCRSCGGTFCRDHIGRGKHNCAAKVSGASSRLPWRKLGVVALVGSALLVSGFVANRLLTGRKAMTTGLGDRGMAVGAYLQYFRDDLAEGSRLGGLRVADLEAFDGELWAATGDGVFRLGGKRWRDESAGLSSRDIRCVGAFGDRLLLGAADGLHELGKDGWSRVGGAIPGCAVSCIHLDDEGTVWVGNGEGVFALESGIWEPKGLSPTTVSCLAGSGECLIAGTDAGLLRYCDGRWENLTDSTSGATLPSADIREVRAGPTGDLWACTAGGVAVLGVNAYCHALDGENGLPFEDARCIAFGLNGTVWVGTSMGLCELRGGRWHYYEGPRWLNDDRILSIHAFPDGSIWIGGPEGMSRIHGELITLEEKAEMINDIVQQRHIRDGYVEFIDLKSPGDFSQNWTYHASDNDGLWTAIYLAAESFRYAATGDPKARENARECYRAMRRLEELTGISGFPARAAVRKGVGSVVKSGGEWHESSVDSGWEWKGDTSSDEVDGHYFAYSIYHDLVADEDEKRDVAALVSRITDHIIDNDYYLIDADGQRTRWGVWNPREINDDPSWCEEHGLNALEILSHLKVAIHMTGEERFERAYRDLIREHHYHQNTINQKILPPGHVNHSDDELAFLAYYPLLLYEDDPYLRSIYLMSMERSWKIERPERSPFFNFVYGAATDADFDLEESVEELKGMSPDLLDWPILNSQRSDVQARQAAGEVFTLPFEDRNMRRWNANAYNLDWWGSGQSEGDGAYFLMPYWMGRYHGFIVEGADQGS